MMRFDFLLRLLYHMLKVVLDRLHLGLQFLFYERVNYRIFAICIDVFNGFCYFQFLSHWVIKLYHRRETLLLIKCRYLLDRVVLLGRAGRVLGIINSKNRKWMKRMHSH